MRIMQEMQAFLAERGIDAHVDTTVSGAHNENHSASIRVFNDECKIVADVKWASYAQDAFEADWAAFEKKVKEEFLAWWE